MLPFIIEATKSTPEVHLDLDEGIYFVGGRSIPIDAEEFYRPVLLWVESLHQDQVSSIDFKFRFEFFNIASSKRILFILYKLSELQENGVSITVTWMYDKFDEDMLEIGQDYALMLDQLTFEFQEFERGQSFKKRSKRILKGV
jgi:hypothetical protein